MKIVSVLGSRNRAGRTAQLNEALVQGSSAGGSACEAVFLTELNVERCRQCDAAG